MSREARKLTIAIPIPPEDRYANYFDALEALGAQGVKVTAGVDPADCDGLLLPGGADVDPARYNQPNIAAYDVNPGLDALQWAALDSFFKAGKPILGICRGHQLLNAYMGGLLIQDVPSRRFHDWAAGQTTDKAHCTVAEPGSWIEALYGRRFWTNSAHHQAVLRPGPEVIVDQHSLDGVIEATHHQTRPAYSVQWHPERMCFKHRRPDTVDGSVLIGWFLDLCGRFAAQAK
ncbi:MAG: gamma-glutamyl-gamma-aminobutyrate hydrolase family protein [Clostridia bacterium]|nr:gamma-glutamyl-gamma-aminobutyrate hydrolase family protein [Clostridia bacterium]